MSVDFTKNGKIRERLSSVYDDSSLLMAGVKNWFNDDDEQRPSALKTVNTKNNIRKVHDPVLADCLLRVHKLTETVESYPAEIMKKLSAPMGAAFAHSGQQAQS